MLRTIEAVIDREGTVELLEAIDLKTPHRAIVTILSDETTPKTDRPFGLCTGEFVVPDDFDDPLPEEILTAFEGS